MVTFAQAQERAERWVNGSASAEPRREVRVREFDLGFVAWAEDPGGGPVGGGKLVIARDSGDTTLWPALPVGDVIRRYEDEYGGTPAPAPAPSGERVDLNATSFLLTPPEWLQEAADRAGVPDQRPEPAAAAPPPEPAPAPAQVPAQAPPPFPEPGRPAPFPEPEPPAAPADPVAPPPVPAPVASAPPSSSPWAGRDTTPPAGSPWDGKDVEPGGGSPWAGTDTSGSGAEAESIAPPATVFSPPVVIDSDSTPPPAAPSSEARTTVLPQGSALPKTRVQDAGPPSPPPSAAPPGTPLGPPPVPGPPPFPGPRGAADLATAETGQAMGGPPSPPGGRGAVVPPPPPPAPGAPGVRPPAAPDSAPNDGGGAYAPTQAVSPEVVASLRNPGQPVPPPGPVPGGPDLPPPGHPGPAAAPPPPPGAGYGYPQPGQPAVGSGYMAVLRYRAPDGSEQQLIRRSAPGMPHPEWQILHELRAMNVPPQQVLELHTELQSCELPGGYCARMIRETWPQVRITHTAAYGQEFSSRQAGVRHLVEHQDELQQFADGPPRSAPVRAPLPQQQPAPAVALEMIGQELVQAFGPQGVFRHTPQTVSRQGVPEIVAQTLVWAGVPTEIAPFFWAQAQPGRPVPTLAELALERGLQPAPDAGSYLVVGTDIGRQLCVQYGSAAIVAVPLEAGPGGQPVPPQFVNASLPQFARCMALLGRMWRLRLGLNSEQAGRWTTDFQAQLASLDPMAVADPESWWSVLLEQMWDGLL
ncbi:SUKH-4 family immunity protein [Streptomyces litchfieldiae]|uniref:SUKH-4 family immunity protein n=1 Tax=Streptomyces litchfieldiae TaxID=3075543 RepID=A0ABU2N0B0_9ACTN|nr:SUKH-4 family immunity protein [Streptomyces sp. DSM 44938]MDT0346963.1 SUKH-4 family immunity protein [Streptomyces sp. DSM 44938]